MESTNLPKTVNEVSKKYPISLVIPKRFSLPSLRTPKSSKSKKPGKDWIYLLSAFLNTFKRTYGAAYVITILPKLVRILVSASGKEPWLSTLKAIRVLMTKHLSNPFPRFLLILFGGFQVLEHLFQLISKKVRQYTNNTPNQASRKRAAALAAFVSSLCAFGYISDGQRTDVALFALVRACDIFVSKLNVPPWVSSAAPTLLFHLSSWQIMYSWFFYPEALPKSYNGWISKLAHLDPKLKEFLYLQHKKATNVYYGGPLTDKIQSLVDTLRSKVTIAGERPTTMPLPCVYAHEGIDGCVNHKLFLWRRGFRDSFIIYAPLNVLSLLLRVKSMSKKNIGPRVGRAILSSAQSSSFLASFIVIIWSVICMARNTFNPLDGPIGPSLGSFFCGLSVLIENPARRHQLALYCLPKAIETFLAINTPLSVKQKLQNHVGLIQSLTFSLSLSFMLRNYRKDHMSVSPTVRSLFRFFLSTNEVDASF